MAAVMAERARLAEEVQTLAAAAQAAIEARDRALAALAELDRFLMAGSAIYGRPTKARAPEPPAPSPMPLAPPPEPPQPRPSAPQARPGGISREAGRLARRHIIEAGRPLPVRTLLDLAQRAGHQVKAARPLDAFGQRLRDSKMLCFVPGAGWWPADKLGRPLTKGALGIR